MGQELRSPCQGICISYLGDRETLIRVKKRSNIIGVCHGSILAVVWGTKEGRPGTRRLV